MNDSQEGDATHAPTQEFFRRLAAFAFIAAGLWVIYALVTDDWDRRPWPIWPTLGMGVAVVIDAWQTFGRRPHS